MALLISGLGTLVFSAMAVVSFYLMRSLMVNKVKRVDFNSYTHETGHVFSKADSEDKNSFKNILKAIYRQDTTKELNISDFETHEQIQELLYDLGKEENPSETYDFGFSLQKRNAPDYFAPLGLNSLYYLDLYRNTSFIDTTFISNVQMSRALWKYFVSDSADINFSSTKLLQKVADIVFSNIGPLMICCGLLTIIPVIVTSIIEDIRGEIRSYMVSCTLRLFPYWLATFIIDYCLWIILITLVWALFLASQIQSFIDNAFLTWYTMVIGGLSFLPFVYCFSFAFKNPDSAARQAFMVLIIILMVPNIVKAIRGNNDNPVWLDYLWSLIPHIGIMNINAAITMRCGSMKESISFYFKDKNIRAYLIFQYVDIVIYNLLLFIIESTRLFFQRKQAQNNFGNYLEFFEKQKQRHPVTQEAKDMADLVHQTDDWAVRIIDVSRLFMNTAGNPIPAVNNVSLGVKKGSLFGFLGANGAGKTTLIRMITGFLPPSFGTIEIEGTRIEDLTDPTVLSICPQFNNHLINELTPAEHFKLYSMLFQLDPNEGEQTTNRLLECLGLDELKDKPIRELSGGDVRKLSIALCFLGPAKIVLLDEPTASLDPVVRHHVHEMLLQWKGEKTFMLCTHLLSEAEFLCDTVSIMIKGNVYTVGSPAYLSEKFGTDFKIDLMLDSDNEESGEKCDAFFAKELPTATLSIQREKARIYSIPAADISLPDLFDKMQEGRENGNGFNYFTCSSSSLERVFMEIVRLSEGKDDHLDDVSEQSEKKATNKNENEDQKGYKNVEPVSSTENEESQSEKSTNKKESQSASSSHERGFPSEKSTDKKESQSGSSSYEEGSQSGNSSKECESKLHLNI